MNEETIEVEKEEEVVEEVKIKVPKFTRPEVIEELTIANVNDIIESQKLALADLEKEVQRKKECITHYQSFLEASE